MGLSLSDFNPFGNGIPGRIIAGAATGGASEGARLAWNNRGAVGLGDVAGPPGVGGPAKDPTQLRQDPATGLFFDPTTGTTYTDATGVTPVASPNTAQQVAANFAMRDAFNRRLASAHNQTQSALADMGQLSSSLSNTINDPNATSVARAQLGQGLQQMANQQLSAAAGVGGQNAFAARRQASQNIAKQGSAANQAQALLRANEVSQAQGRLSQVLGQRAGITQDQYKTDAGIALNYSDQARRGRQEDDDDAASAAEGTRKQRRSILAGVVDGISTFASGGANKAAGA